MFTFYIKTNSWNKIICLKMDQISKCTGKNSRINNRWSYDLLAQRVFSYYVPQGPVTVSIITQNTKTIIILICIVSWVHQWMKCLSLIIFVFMRLVFDSATNVKFTNNYAYAIALINTKYLWNKYFGMYKFPLFCLCSFISCSSFIFCLLFASCIGWMVGAFGIGSLMTVVFAFG